MNGISGNIADRPQLRPGNTRNASIDAHGFYAMWLMAELENNKQDY
jgi:hypothetical protein